MTKLRTNFEHLCSALAEGRVVRLRHKTGRDMNLVVLDGKLRTGPFQSTIIGEDEELWLDTDMRVDQLIAIANRMTEADLLNLVAQSEIGPEAENTGLRRGGA